MEKEKIIEKFNMLNTYDTNEMIELKEEYAEISSCIIDKYGPEGAFEIAAILNKLIDKDLSMSKT